MTRRRSRALLRGPLEPVRDPPACGLCREPCLYGGVAGPEGMPLHASCWTLVARGLRAAGGTVRGLNEAMAATGGLTGFAA